jgi:hypothetical protein
MAERFIRTLLAGCAYGAIYRDNAERSAALADWLETYNRRRPHGAIGHKPPIARLNELLLRSYTCVAALDAPRQLDFAVGHEQSALADTTVAGAAVNLNGSRLADSCARFENRRRLVVHRRQGCELGGFA